MTTAFQTVDVRNINISDVINLHTALNVKKTKITYNSYLSISDVSGLSTALENVVLGDINISDVIYLQTAVNDKLNKITSYFILVHLTYQV